MLRNELDKKNFEIYKKIGIEQPTAVRTLDRLERDGFISRKRGSQDRRLIYINLTEKGRRTKSVIQTCAQELNKKALCGFSTSEIEQLVNKKNKEHTILDKIYTISEAKDKLESLRDFWRHNGSNK